MCCALGLSWQLLTVHFNYGGNLTALFCHGSQYPLPAGLAAEHIYVFPNSGGYDGQSYHYMAHDLFDRTDIGRAIPDPSLRYPREFRRRRRPTCSRWAGPNGSMCLSCCATCCFWDWAPTGWGGCWSAPACTRCSPFCIAWCRWRLSRWTAWWWTLALTSLALGFAVHLEPESPWKLYIILVAAALCREMGFLLWGGYVIRLVWLRRYRQVAIFATAILPGLLWTMWVRSAMPRGDAFGIPPIRPLWGMVEAVLHPRAYPFSAAEVAVIRVLDWLQVAGILLADLDRAAARALGGAAMRLSTRASFLLAWH